MSTIPITFNENIPAYTILGGKKNIDENSENLFSVFILNRSGSIISDKIFENVLALKFKSVFAILNNVQSASIDSLTEKFPTIKFIRSLEKITPGEMINIAASESCSKFFIVLWTDTVITSQGFIAAMVDQLSIENKVCIVPSLLNARGENIPNQIIPVLRNNKYFSTEILNTHKNKTTTLYPIDYIAIYKRENFIALTGFDHTIKNPYWQLLDFSLRSFLWGNDISVACSFKVEYISELSVADATADDSYRQFFLKNIAPLTRTVNKNTEAYIPYRIFFSYLKNSGENIFASWKRFKGARAWVSVTRNRFKKSALELLSSWELDL